MPCRPLRLMRTRTDDRFRLSYAANRTDQHPSSPSRVCDKSLVSDHSVAGWPGIGDGGKVLASRRRPDRRLLPRHGVAVGRARPPPERCAILCKGALSALASPVRFPPSPVDRGCTESADRCELHSAATSPCPPTIGATTIGQCFGELELCWHRRSSSGGSKSSKSVLRVVGKLRPPLEPVPIVG